MITPAAEPNTFGDGPRTRRDERGQVTVGIVGAGITGLSLHRFLSDREIESIVFESSDRPGGVIRTATKDDRVLDLGPQRTRFSPGVRDLVEAAGVADQVIEANDDSLYVYHDGDLGRVPRSVAAAIRTDLLTWRGKARALLEPFAGPPRETETVAAYFERAFGPEVATRVGGPLYAGLYASDPAEMPVEYSLAKALAHYDVDRSVLLAAMWRRLRGGEAPPAISFEDGMATLPRGLYRTADDVRLSARVEAVRPRHGGYELDLGGDGYPVDRVVLTVPAGAAAELLRDLVSASAAALDELAYNPLVVVHLYAETALRGAGHQMSLETDFVTRGVTWNDSLLDRDGVYTCFLGGATRPETVTWSDDRLADVAVEEFERVTGSPAEPIAVHRITPGMPAYDDSWDALQRVEVPPGIHLCANYESRAGIPGRIRQARALADRIETESVRGTSEDDERRTRRGAPGHA